ncbi:hypothetical protein BXY75_1281 [Ulvibacter antarcticus]|uniref:Uncharacterized protein n=1 Tax=Ulvibacter antarcticus TaxID=442714 RepID=A0A3L9YUR7_9FLAO|nr:hypothetical protein BXY75_1281 [Ulvibacter antarcticus]
MYSKEKLLHKRVNINNQLASHFLYFNLMILTLLYSLSFAITADLKETIEFCKLK